MRLALLQKGTHAQAKSTQRGKTERDQQMDTIPLELVNCIFGWTDALSMHMFQLVCVQWRILVNAQRGRAFANNNKIVPVHLVHGPVPERHTCRDRSMCVAYHASLVIARGRWAILDWMLDQRPSLFKRMELIADFTDVYVCAQLAAHGDLARLGRAHAAGFSWISCVCCAAAQWGHLDVLKWLKASQCGRTCLVSSSAAYGGHLHVLRWALADNGYGWNSTVWRHAAEQGHTHILEYARDYLKCDWPGCLCKYAARGGQLETLKWLRARDVVWGMRTTKAAARHGHLAVLQWAVANGCPWNEWTCTGAAKGGHLEILQWAIDNGCPWDGNVRAVAERHGHGHILEWLDAQSI